MAVDSKRKIKDGSVGEGFYFCLIHKKNALCGSGESINDNGTLITSDDALKLLESIEFDND